MSIIFFLIALVFISEQSTNVKSFTTKIIHAFTNTCRLTGTRDFPNHRAQTTTLRVLPSGPGDLFMIPVNTVKPSGLRLSLSLVALGMQNTPVKGAWVAQQEDEGVTLFWNDGTAALNVKIGYVGVAFTRMGEEPSLSYQLNESTAIRTLLEELESYAKGGEDGEEVVEEGNRLVTLTADGWTAMEKAQNMLIKDAS
mmetsp:Transcript_19920/g.41613  ORF Transcript_19920/g.41613 Transcript_19920/m.41613 type:complete len:197 (-) Transcript_19920:9-599(-)